MTDDRRLDDANESYAFDREWRHAPFLGVWGIVVKLVTNEIGMQALVWGQLGAICLFPLYFFLFKEILPLELKASTIALSVVAGMLGVLGTMTF